MSSKLVIATGNQGKIKEFSYLLRSYPVDVIAQPKDLEVEEIGLTFRENARLKAFAAVKRTGQIALADDSGLNVDALGGAPGIHSARYAATDNERIMRVLNELKDVKDRRAVFCTTLCMAFPDKNECLEFEGLCEGQITFSPRGSNGFGYDPIFEVYGTGLTFAEMNKTEKQLHGHRGKAFKLLELKLPKILEV